MPGRYVPRKDTAVGVGILLILVALLPFGCAQYDSDVGSSIVGGGFEGEVKETTFPVTRDSTRTLGDQYKMLTAALPVGVQDGLHSWAILSYQNFNFGDTLLSVSEATVRIEYSGYIDSLGVTDWTPWEAEVFRIDEWYNPIQLRYDTDLVLTPMDTLMVDPNEMEASFQLDDSTLYRWVNDTLDYGLLIRPLNGAGFIRNFWIRPSDAEQIPTLTVTATYVDDDTTFTDEEVVVNPTNTSTFLVDDERVFGAAERIQLSTAYVRNALIYGDFSQFDPGKVSINRVQLIVKVDTTWQYNFGNQQGKFTWNYPASDWFNSPLDSITIGSELSTSAYGSYLIRDTTTFVDSMAIDITPIVRTWVSLPEENFGVLVRFQSEGDLMRRAAIYSSEATDPANRPYFRVTYTEYDTP
ncbi:DNRLRE domain-containing protein [bacterium]|nr:DNRLRE domain-containing protein [bacterium]